ncbi:hypothetical protein F5H01DRAFT_347764 [Linnemannia elongata]|nr:hypothetical protein F5H01DRAFT_347764 [Linnemannia elongata]
MDGGAHQGCSGDIPTSGACVIDLPVRPRVMLMLELVERVLSHRVMPFVFVLLVIHALLGSLCLGDELWEISVVLVFWELVLVYELAVLMSLGLLLRRRELVMILAVATLDFVVSQHCLYACLCM